MKRSKLAAWLVVGTLAVSSSACDGEPSEVAGPEDDPEGAALLHVAPPGGATDVDPTEPVVLGFDHPVSPLMTRYAALHEGDVTGDQVPGSWSLSDDGTELTFVPDAPLKAATLYTIHLGGAMTDVHGHMVELEEHGPDMGGEWAWEEMFGHEGSGEMGHGGGMGGGEWEGHTHMDESWQHANGAYGMVFQFTTAG